MGNLIPHIQILALSMTSQALWTTYPLWPPCPQLSQGPPENQMSMAGLALAIMASCGIQTWIQYLLQEGATLPTGNTELHSTALSPSGSVQYVSKRNK